MNKIKTENQPTYKTNKLNPMHNTGKVNLQLYNEEYKDGIIELAKQILLERLKNINMTELTSSHTTREYLTVKLAQLEHEVFGCLFVNTKHELIKDVELFRGTIDHSYVYPREVVKEALKHNAGAVVFYHNHPSCNNLPSSADKRITNRLKTALKMFDIKTLDHVIVGGVDAYSFADNGEI